MLKLFEGSTRSTAGPLFGEYTIPRRRILQKCSMCASCRKSGRLIFDMYPNVKYIFPILRLEGNFPDADARRKLRARNKKDILDVQEAAAKSPGVGKLACATLPLPSWLRSVQLALSINEMRLISDFAACACADVHASFPAIVFNEISFRPLDPAPDSRSSEAKRSEFRTELNPPGRSGRFVPRLSRKHRR